MRVSLKPADLKHLAVAVRKIIAFGRNHNIKMPDPASVTEDYCQHLKALPSDLLDKAVLSLTGTWRWGNRLPMPAEILEAVQEEMTARVVMRGKVRMAMERLQPEKRGPFVDQSAVDEIMRKNRLFRADPANKFKFINRGIK